MRRDEDRAAVGIGQRDGDRHLAAERRIVGLEFDHLDDLFIRDKPGEATVEGVGVGGRLAGAGRRVIGERDAEGAAFAGIERAHVAGHAGRHHPRRHGARVDQRPIDGRARGIDVEADAGRARARALAGTARRVSLHMRTRFAVPAHSPARFRVFDSAVRG